VYGTALHRGNGEYWLARDDSIFREGAEGWWDITVRAEGYPAQTEKYDRNAIHILYVMLHAPAYLVVEIAGIDGHPYQERFQLVRRTQVDAAAVHIQLAPSASRRYGPLRPGGCTLELALDNPDCTIERISVDVLAGDNRVTLTAPELFSFTVLVPPEHRGKRMNVRRVDNFRYSVPKPTDQEEEFEASGLFAGEHVIWCTGAGEMRVSLPAAHGQKILFQPLPFNALRVSYRFAREGSSEALGLRDGDVVVEVDGAALADAEDASALAWESYNKEETVWIVQRDGQRLELRLKGAELADSRILLIDTRTD
jgi:hypothetical protein